MRKSPIDLLQKLAIVLPVIAVLLTTGVLSSTAYAASATNLSGVGHGTVICPNGRQGEAVIELLASVSNGIVSGGFEVFSGFGIGFSGIIDAGRVTTSHYNLIGTTVGFFDCFAPLPPTSFTIKGRCGTGVTIHLSADDGMKGTFAGLVTCT